MGLTNKVKELDKLQHEQILDKALLTETKKKLNGTSDLNNCTMI